MKRGPEFSNPAQKAETVSYYIANLRNLVDIRGLIDPENDPEKARQVHRAVETRSIELARLGKKDIVHEIRGRKIYK